MQRYLRNTDYYRSILSQKLSQLTEDDEVIISDAEGESELSIVNWLSNEYEIEKEFDLGRSIKDFSPSIEKVADELVWVNSMIYKITDYCQPNKFPGIETFWEEVSFTIYDPTKEDYMIGDIVEYQNGLYEFKYEGYLVSEHISSSNKWVLLSEYEYDQQDDHDAGDYVKYQGLWFRALRESGPAVGLIAQPFFNRWEPLVLQDISLILTPSEGDLGTDGGELKVYKLGSWEDQQYFQYSDESIYKSGDYTIYEGAYFKARLDISMKENYILPPTLTQLWKEITISDFAPATDYSALPGPTVVIYNSQYYELYNLTGYVVGDSPDQATLNWRVVQINEYSEDTAYQVQTYVQYDDQFYYIESGDTIYVNADTIETSPTFFKSIRDPRNKNVVKWMVDISLYCLNRRIVPDNISVARDNAYREAMLTLEKCNRLKVNPSIPRKTDDNGNTVSDWVVNSNTSNTWLY